MKMTISRLKAPAGTNPPLKAKRINTLSKDNVNSLKWRGVRG